MKTKAIEILIAAIVVAVLFGVVFCFVGCKDKAEAATKSRVAQKVDEDIRRASEPNDITTITLPDPNDISYNWEVYLEVTLTNEPNFAETDRIYLYEGDEFDIVIEKKEPNEPKKFYTTEELDEIYKDELELTFVEATWEPYNEYDLNHIIPTWPDYIKLEKDLIASYPHFEGHTVINLLPKGTKIYFKDKAE